MEGLCHCGTVRWVLDGLPASVTACSCSVCRRYGALWTYGFEGETVRTTGRTTAYVGGRGTAEFHFCATCGGVAYWRERTPGPLGRRQIGVNLRMVTDPAWVAGLPVDHVDGLNDDFGHPRRDHRLVSDLWF